MKDYILYVLLICIYHSILLFDKHLGLNALLFIVPLLILIYIILKKNKKIINKKGLLLFIPILLLTAGYLIYHNSVFNTLNILVIPLLFILMFIFTTSKKVTSIIPEVFKVIFEPIIYNIGNSYRLLNLKLDKLIHLEPGTKKKLKSFIIVIPLVIIVIYILSTADMIFGNIFKNVADIIKNVSVGSLIGRIIRIIILFTYLGAVLNYIVYKYKASEGKKEHKKLNSYTFKVLFTSLNLVYILFDYIQIKSLYLHNISMNISYAEYARTGFFQLMFISLLNLLIILLSKKSDENKYNKVMALIMVFLTFIIILSSTYRMYMYECAYGYTVLRLLVYLTLFTEVILLIPTVLYIFHNINVWKHYFIIIVTIYTLASLAPINYVIAKKNISRFEKDGKIDIHYLENDSSDNVPLLIEVYDKLNEEDQKSLKIYLNDLKDYFEVHDIRDFNLSKQYATKLLKENAEKFDNDVEES